MSTEVQLITADELLALPRGQFRYELINGELKRMSPAGHNHGRIIMRLSAPLTQYVRKHQLGEAYAAETGFKLTSKPDTVRAPDIAFIRQERVDEAGDTAGYWVGAPDLAVEVLSPDDRATKVKEKVFEWLTAGSEEVWVINPERRTVMVYRSPTEIITLTENDLLEGRDVVPGFRIEVKEIFA